MATNQQTTSDNRKTDWRLDTEKFVEWCEQQIKNSKAPSARIIAHNDEMIRFRIREQTDRGPEDIVLIKGKEVDSIKFERGEETRGFHLHRRDVKLADKTLLVKTDGVEMCRAGTGTRNKRGPFPV